MVISNVLIERPWDPFEITQPGPLITGLGAYVRGGPLAIRDAGLVGVSAEDGIYARRDAALAAPRADQTNHAGQISEEAGRPVHLPDIDLVGWEPPNLLSKLPRIALEPITAEVTLPRPPTASLQAEALPGGRTFGGALPDQAVTGPDEISSSTSPGGVIDRGNKPYTIYGNFDDYTKRQLEDAKGAFIAYADGGGWTDYHLHLAEFDRLIEKAAKDEAPGEALANANTAEIFRAIPIGDFGIGAFNILTGDGEFRDYFGVGGTLFGGGPALKGLGAALPFAGRLGRLGGGANKSTVTMYRVDDAAYPSRIAADGTIPLVPTRGGGERALFVGFDKKRATDFSLVNRQGNATITAVEVDASFLARLRATAIYDKSPVASLDPHAPLKVDINKGPDQFGLRTPEQIQMLRDAIKPETVRVITPKK